MFKVLEVLSTTLANLVRNFCVMVYSSSRPLQAKQAKKSYRTQRSFGQSLRQGGRRESKRGKRKTRDDRFNVYFQDVFDDAKLYQAKDKDEIKLNKAKIPKLQQQPRKRRAANKESKVSIDEIKVQLQQKSRRKLRRSTSQILGIEKRGKIPQVILRRAKKQRQELNPEFFEETPRPLRLTRSTACLFTQSHAAKKKKNLTPSTKKGIGEKITRNSEKRSEKLDVRETNEIQRTRSGRLVKKRFKLSF